MKWESYISYFCTIKLDWENEHKEVEWDGLPVPKRYWAILAIAMGITVSVLDGTIANVALPSIARIYRQRRRCLSGS